MIAFRIILLATTLFLLGASTTRQAHAQVEQTCPEDLNVAENAYFNGEFDRVISLLQPCIDQDAYDAEDAQRAYTLLGRTQFVLDDVDAARDAIEQLYLLNPTYEPDPQFPPNFIAFINGVRQDMLAVEVLPGNDQQEVAELVPEDLPEIEEDFPQKNTRRNKLLIFGGGAAIAVGVTAAILAGGGSSDNPSTWPLPPGRP